MIVPVLSQKHCLDCGKKINPGERARVTKLVDVDTLHILNEHRCVNCEYRGDGTLVLHNTAVTGTDGFNLGHT
jgi:DNA-directed RNA polymerase subunit RPC12/RpoP